MIYRKKWKKRWPQSLLSYLRDSAIFLLPFRLPLFLRTAFFGFNPLFVFLVHPRRKEDIFIALPFLRPLRYLLPKKLRYKIIQAIPPFVLGKITTQNGVNGLVITTTKLPDFLLARRKESLREAHKCIHFASKLANQGSYFGLGGWWPMITRRGLAVNRFAKKLGFHITNGHTGTLCSLVMTSKKIAHLCNLPSEDMSVLVMGVGKMGSNLVKALYGRFQTIYIYDKNIIKETRLGEEIQRSLLNCKNSEIICVEPNTKALRDALSKSDICICTTSNIRRILKPIELPENVLIIDDSRPEAFSRILDRGKNILVLEGGLLKILSCKTDYNFGFGMSGNVFGCLAEVYLLSCDQGKELRPTLGDVDLNNFSKMLSVLKQYGVEVGDFRCSNLQVGHEAIKNIVLKKRPAPIFENAQQC